MASSTEQLTGNIRARDQAALVYELAIDTAGTIPASVVSRFWQVLLVAVSEHVPPDQRPKAEVGPDAALADTEARCFETTRMPFGKHLGERVEDVPMDYLLYIDDMHDYRRQLRRYLKSARGQARQEEPDDE